MDIQIAKSELLKEIENLRLNNNPPELYEPIRYILNIGGKRMRPLLTLLGCYLYDSEYQKAVKPAVAVEVFHNFTLMHDDIMDNAPKRRGQDTVHEKWNPNIAILSGDAMLIEAYNLMLSIEPAILPEVLRIFNRCALEVCEGQQFDMNFEERESVSLDEYMEMIRLKTSVLLGFALQMGALIGGAPSQEALKLCEFGVCVGLGFQLKDDLLDVYGDPEKFGKQVGGDILSNKKTYLLIRALEKAEGKTLEQLNYWLNAANAQSEGKVKAVTAIYDGLGIKAETENEISAYFDRAFQMLDALNADKERITFLEKFTENLIGREE